MPLDALLLQTEPGQDEFVNEKYAAQISTILHGWSASLLRSAHDLQPIEKVLDANFLAAPFAPSEARVVRPGPPIEIRENQFEQSLTKSREEFLTGLRDSLAPFSEILTADFQITNIQTETDRPQSAPIQASPPDSRATPHPHSL